MSGRQLAVYSRRDFKEEAKKQGPGEDGVWEAAGGISQERLYRGGYRIRGPERMVSGRQQIQNMNLK